MSFTLVRRSKAILVMFALVTLSTILFAQTAQKEQKAPVKGQPGQSIDKYEEVHRGLFTPQTDKAKEAGRFTEEVSSALPGRTVTGKLPRKNFIDEYIFGKMEKDGIPYAGLSSDEEFIRRAYVDATGLLPSPAGRRPVGPIEPSLRRHESVEMGPLDGRITRVSFASRHARPLSPPALQAPSPLLRGFGHRLPEPHRAG